MRACTSTNIHSFLNGRKHGFSAEKSVEACRNAGFHAIDIDLNTQSLPPGPLSDDRNWKEWVLRLSDRIEELGMDVPSCHAFCYLYPERSRRGEELTIRSIEAAGMLGAKSIVMHPYSVSDESGFSYSGSLGFNRERLMAYLDAASRYGMSIALENMVGSTENRRFSSFPEDLIELIGSIEGDVGICWDFGHGERSGIRTEDALRSVGGYLKVIHVHDWTLDKTGFDHTLPFMGRMDWDAAMPVLREIGFEGDMNLECQNYAKNMPECLRKKALELAYETACALILKTGLVLEE